MRVDVVRRRTKERKWGLYLHDAPPNAAPNIHAYAAPNIHAYASADPSADVSSADAEADVHAYAAADPSANVSSADASAYDFTPGRGRQHHQNCSCGVALGDLPRGTCRNGRRGLAPTATRGSDTVDAAHRLSGVSAALLVLALAA